MLMRRIVFILTLLAFVTGGFAQIVHAAAPDLCSHESMTIDKTDIDTDCRSVDQASQDNQNAPDFEICDDCLCHHSHILGQSFSALDYTPIYKEKRRAPDYSLSSRAPPTIYRPPIA